ncbi:hypothetical protein [Micromonospora halophytica]|uniref:Peptidase M10 metallopeptidase domain-containing protein n=1 Tax=Micromonospora halophytica TaxID=47864 RepID=A0A1C5HHM1_9ACTN|nr:hypothetical protein [Micromonospora halophytica]SCG45413.1 hypothetical protein GA0070560_104192 [Micromonospora halophytica]
MKRTTMVLGAALTAVLAFAPPALAGHGGKANSGKPDNKEQDVESNSLTTNGKAAVSHGRAQLNRSQINTSTGNSDIHVYDKSYSASWYGQTSCTDTNWWNGLCDHYDVKFNTRMMSGKSTYYWQSLGCHELGHTGSLGHRWHSTDSNDNSCMRSNIWPKYLDLHDIDAINDNV